MDKSSQQIFYQYITVYVALRLLLTHLYAKKSFKRAVYRFFNLLFQSAGSSFSFCLIDVSIPPTSLCLMNAFSSLFFFLKSNFTTLFPFIQFVTKCGFSENPPKLQPVSKCENCEIHQSLLCKSFSVSVA